MLSFSNNLLKRIKFVIKPVKFSHKEILFISLILAFSLAISFILFKGVLFIIIFNWNFFLFLFVFKFIDILYHLFSSILVRIILLFFLLSDNISIKFISASIFNKNLFPLLNKILNILLNIKLLCKLLLFSVLLKTGFKRHLKHINKVIPSFIFDFSLLDIVGIILMLSLPLKK